MNNKNIKTIAKLSAVSIAIAALSGCAGPRMSHEINQGVYQNSQMISQSLDKPHSTIHHFMVSNSRYVDHAQHILRPQWMSAHVEIHAHQQPLRDVVAQITQGKQVNVSYDNDLDSQLINIDYSGDLGGALDNIVDKNNIYYSLGNDNGSSIVWSNLQTKTFDISYTPGTTKFNVGGSQNNSNMSNGDSSSATLSGNISVWQEIQGSVSNMLSKGGKMDISQATSSLTVTDKPSNVERIARFMKDFNQSLSRRVRIHVKVLEVTLNQQHNFGINWNLVYKQTSLFALNGGASQALGGLSAGEMLLPNSDGNSSEQGSGMGNFTGTTALIQALDTQGKTSVVEEPTLSTLNNQPSTVSITDKQTYVKRASVTSTVDPTTQTITRTYDVQPDNINTGLKMTLVPHIEGNKVYLSIDGNISSLKDIKTRSFGEGKDSPIEMDMPETQNKSFNQRMMVNNGRLVVLGGLKTKELNKNVTKNFSMEPLGSNQQKIINKELVVLIQPEILY